MSSGHPQVKNMRQNCKSCGYPFEEEDNEGEYCFNCGVMMSTGDLAHSLADDEKKSLNPKFGPGFDMERDWRKIGEDYNITRERLREIEAKALRKIRRLGKLKIGDAPPDDVA